MSPKVVSCLGKGSSAVVYRCARPAFAVKVFTGRENVARARHEAAVLERVTPHTHVIGVVGSSFAEARACILLQLADGCLLDLTQPVLTLPTPGGPTKHKIGPLIFSILF